MLDVKKWIAKMSTTVLVGEIKPYAGNNEPTGWLKCDGRAISRTDYAALFDVIGTTYGPGDGSSTFNLPDMRDRFPVGAGSTYNLNDRGGENTHTLTVNEMPSHTHTQNSHQHQATSYNQIGYSSGSTQRRYPVNYADTGKKADWVTSGTTATNQNTGGGKAHENRPPYIGINFLIYVGGGSS